MRISDWCSDVCSSDLVGRRDFAAHVVIGRADMGMRIDQAGGYVLSAAVDFKISRRRTTLGLDGQVRRADVVNAGDLVALDDNIRGPPGRRACAVDDGDRKSTRLNSSH